MRLTSSRYSTRWMVAVVGLLLVSGACGSSGEPNVATGTSVERELSTGSGASGGLVDALPATAEFEACRTLYGEKPWITLFEAAQTIPCVVVADFQNLQIWNKGFVRLTVDWPGGERELESDDWFETGPIGEILGESPGAFDAVPYPMPVIHMMPREQSPSLGLTVTSSRIGPAEIGMTLAEASALLGLDVMVESNSAPGPSCWHAVIHGDPYSPFIVVSGDGTADSRITAIVWSGDDRAAC